jgi:1-acyl-sn-glycerol-3-phosphate acyltransferase
LFIQLVVRLSSRVTVYGLENLPKTGGGCRCQPHRSPGRSLRLPHINRQDVIMLVAENIEKPPWRWFVKSIDAIFIDRFNADVSTVQAVLRRIDAGGLW